MTTKIRQLLEQFKAGDVDQDEVIQRLVRQPFEEHMLGRFDQHREARTGIPEAILAEGKDPEAVADIFRTYLDRGEQLIATRVGAEIVEALAGPENEGILPQLHHFSDARIVSTQLVEPVKDRHTVMVISAGALDKRVAEEASVTAELLGNRVDRVFDVGVAGLTRFATELDRFDKAGIIIVCAGMDGALPSIVGGLAVQPVIAVPTSVGYGASFGGIAPLLTMLNSCSPGTATMNIDNGFGAAVLATKMNQLAGKK
jgi:NCAIR mutase (PurE)-related protein